MAYPPNHSRRTFLKYSSLSALALTSSPLLAYPVQRKTPVALMACDDRADNIFQGLKCFESQIKAAIGNRRVVLKPNNVSINNQLAATHAQALEGTLEFFKSIGVDNIVIAESAAAGSTMDGFEEFGYLPLAEKYNAKLMDLDQEDIEIVKVGSEKNDELHPVRMSKILLDRDNYIVSNAVVKTHDRVVATLSLKNIVFGAPIKDIGFAWGSSRKPGTTIDKPIAHGDGYIGINDNLRLLAPKLHPDLAIIDGYEGMQGNGPVGGTPVDHKIAIVSPHWLAADRTAIELMGIDFNTIGYLNYCYQDGLGEANLDNIEIIGATLQDHIKTYQLSSSIDKQLEWMRRG